MALGRAREIGEHHYDRFGPPLVLIAATLRNAMAMSSSTGMYPALGNNEFSAQSESIEAPFSVMTSTRRLLAIAKSVARTTTINRLPLFLLGNRSHLGNFIVPLNDQGLRTDFIPTVEIEYAFSAPW